MDGSSNQQWRAAKQEVASSSDAGNPYTFEDLLAELYSTDVSSTDQVDLTERMYVDLSALVRRELLLLSGVRMHSSRLCERS